MKGHIIVSIYFGGGTPFLWGSSFVGRFLELILRDFSLDKGIEITIEANPETISPKKLLEYRKLGVNRISIGVQSFQNSLLNILSREHSSQRAVSAIEEAYIAGFKNISIDLMYDLPTQNQRDWYSSVNRALCLPISHLSLYNLTFEPKTAFFARRSYWKMFLPSEEQSAFFYEWTIATLTNQKWEQYELSAFTFNGSYSLHNVGYWTGRPFIGMGPSAHSYWRGKRSKNLSSLFRYSQKLRNKLSPVDFSEELSTLERRRELFVIRLRLLLPVSLREFQKEHGPLEENTLKKLGKLIQEEFIHSSSSGKIVLTNKGKRFYDWIASELI